MLIIKCSNDKIDSAIKKYRQKVKNTKLINELKERRHFTKKSEKRRATVLKAIHKNKVLSTQREELD
jgi:small subunit ribosomal protein S21